MAAGDLWVRSDSAYAHFSPTGTLIAHQDAASGYGDFENPPSLAHDGQSLWTVSDFLPSGAAGKVHRLDPTTLTVLDSHDFTSQSSQGLAYDDGAICVNAAGHIVAVSGSPWTLEVDHTGTKIAEIGDLSYTEATAIHRRSSIAPATSKVVFVSADNSFSDTVVQVTTWDLGSNTRTVVSAPKPGTGMNASTWNIAAKTNGGFWLSWHNVAGAFGAMVLTEHHADGSLIQRVDFPNDDPYYNEITGMDVDSAGNLFCALMIYAGATTPNTNVQLAKVASGTGTLTLLGSAMDPSVIFAGTSDGTLFALHIERGSGPSIPPPLRQFQRDDGLDKGSVRQFGKNGPTSLQFSQRQFGRTYL